MRYPPFRWREIGLMLSQTTATLVFAMTMLLCHAATSTAQEVAAPDLPSGAFVIPVAPRILTLPEARQLARSHSPLLDAASWAAVAADRRIQDAGRRDNPALGTTFENFGASLPSGTSELTVDITQSIDLGGARRARSDVALAGRDIARAEWWVETRTLDAYVSESFLDAWIARERLRKAREARELAVELLDTANDRLKAGAASVVERARAEANIALRSAEMRVAESTWGIARRRLAQTWGAGDAQIDSLVLPIPEWSAPAPLDSLIPRLEQHPEVVRARAEARIAALRIRAARAARVPDLALRFGARQFSESGDIGFVAGAGVPIPFWNRGLGTVSAAAAERSGADVRVRAAQIRLGGELRSAYERLTASAATWQDITQQVLPSVEAAFAALRTAYRMGRIGYVDVLEGQRAVIETRLLALNAARDVWSARLELERLTDVTTRGPRDLEGR